MSNNSKSIVVFFFLIFANSNISFGQKHTGYNDLGFYLYNNSDAHYPFSIKTWSISDYSTMFNLLNGMGYDKVMLWPMLEAIPAPLDQEDSLALEEYQYLINLAHLAGMSCWVVQHANLTASTQFDEPWQDRIPYDSWKQVKFDEPQELEPYLAHRRRVISNMNNADAYLTIYGDLEASDLLKVFQSDRAILDSVGDQPPPVLMPWIGGGKEAWPVWGGNPVLIKPFNMRGIGPLMGHLPEPWGLMVVKSNHDDLAWADSLGLIPKITILCYEAIENEPTPPVSHLQFDTIRKVLRRESNYMNSMKSLFTSAQFPVMELPNMYFFGMAAKDTSYLSKKDDEILHDFALFLGGDPKLLTAALKIEETPLEGIPHGLTRGLRKMYLKSWAADKLPGDRHFYVDMLAREVECRTQLLQATQTVPANDNQSVIQFSQGIFAIFDWWKFHGYVAGDSADELCSLNYVPKQQLDPLLSWLNKLPDPQMTIKKTSEIIRHLNQNMHVQLQQLFDELTVRLNK